MFWEIIPVRDWEKLFNAPGVVLLSSARSTTERVADWPLHLTPQVRTKSSAMRLPRDTVSMEVLAARALTQSV